MTEGTQAAPSLLGSTLLTLAEAHANQRPSPASSGLAVIDECVLDGGFRYGEITSLAGAASTGKTLLAYHAAASHLLAHASGEVAFIDSTGSFSPIELRDVIAFRLSILSQRGSFEQADCVYKRPLAAECFDGTEIMQEATSILDRVKVMRVFDLAGVAEAVGEVTEMITEDPSVVDIGAKGRAISAELREISDSEDELESINDSETGPRLRDRPKPEPPPVGMIIIDSVTNVVSSMVAKNQLQGQALLATLMRSLHQLTSRHHICTILINAAVATNTFMNSEYQRRPEENVSSFASTLGRPALGKTFTYLIDTSIFLSAVPESKHDATWAYGERTGPQEWRSAIVLEVLKDRNGARQGRWAAFEIASKVEVVPC
ncbi:MAG: hypothetical protein Q9217_006198 [Psora testacea]